ncbi:ProP Permeases of the major facilitator superfamily [Burkholderiales bacterium]
MLGFSSYAVSLVELQALWQLSNTESGLVASAFFIGYMSLVSMWNALTDRRDPREIYAVGSALAAAGSLGFALFASGFVSGFFWQFLLGAGVAATYMPGLRILSDQFEPGARQSRFVSFYTAFFGVGAAASLWLSGWAVDALDWRWSFGLAALGPMAAWALMWMVTQPCKPPEEAIENLALSSAGPHWAWRWAMMIFPVPAWKVAWQSPAVRGYTIGYGVHCLELFGSRAWTVAFLVFAFGVGSGASPWSAAAVAAFVNLISTPASILGNEFALRMGRRRWILWVMASGSLVGVAMALLAQGPWWMVVVLMSIYSCLIMADSATLTAGFVGSAPAAVKGAAMGLYSLVGFGLAAVGPAIFGLALDLSGGAQVPMAWAAAFLAIGAGCLGYVFAERRLFRGEGQPG